VVRCRKRGRGAKSAGGECACVHAGRPVACRMSSRQRSPACLKKGTCLIITELVSLATLARNAGESAAIRRGSSEKASAESRPARPRELSSRLVLVLVLGLVSNRSGMRGGMGGAIKRQTHGASGTRATRGGEPRGCAWRRNRR